MATSVVVVDDSRVDRELTLDFLRERGYNARGSAGGVEGLALCRDVQPDIVLLDMSASKVEGLQVLAAIRADSALWGTPVVVMTTEASPDLAADAIERGADDFVRKQSHVELLARIETVRRRRAVAGTLERRAALLATTASKDLVTELPNRLLLEQELGRLMASSRRHDRPLCVLLVGVDGDGGDDVLRLVAAALKDRLRASDFVGRWGTNEFLVLLPDTLPEGTERVADDVRATVEQAGAATVSIGWARWTGGSGLQLIARAEQALRDARSAGPNTLRGG